MRNISNGAKKAIFASQTGSAFFAVVKISHADWLEDIFIVNNNVSIDYDGDTYLPFAFRFKPPSETENGMSDPAKIVIDNVDRQIVTMMRTISSPAAVSSAIVMVDNTGAVTKEAGWWDFELRNVSYSAMQLSGDLIYNISLSDYVSRHTYNNIDFPGMF